MKPVVVCGLGRFGMHVVEAFCRVGTPVTVISNEKTNQSQIEQAKKIGVPIITGDFQVASVRRKANITDAAAVILTTSSDVNNLEAALEIRGEYSHVPVVIRHSEPHLSSRFQADFGIAAALSPAELAAQSFVNAALEVPHATSSLKRKGSPVAVPLLSWRKDVAFIPLLLFVLYVCAIVVFHQSLGLDWIDAAYFATSIVTTVGFGDFNLQFAPWWIKLFGILLMFGGIVLIAIISSLLTIFIVSGTAAQLRNQIRARSLREHIVICGLGRVGTAIVRDLRRRGIAVVAVDPNADDHQHRELKLRCPMIVGDATRSTVLVQAGIHRARALVVCTTNDALNLEIGLVAQTIREVQLPTEPMRVVLRCFDNKLAQRIHRVSKNYTLLSESKIASPAFVEKALAHAMT